MCYNCGCQRPNDDMGNPKNITNKTFEEAAKAEPEQKAAAASYVGVALRAFEDVEDALAHDYYLRRREEALGEMVSASAEAVKLGRVRIGEGQETMFTVLRLAGENLAAKIELTKIRASRLRMRALRAR